MLDVTGLDAAVNLLDPADRLRWSNSAPVEWWLALPDLMGGPKWRGLMDRHPSTLAGPPTWQPPTRPGGYGELAFGGTSDSVDCGAPLAGRGLSAATIAGWMYKASSTSGIATFGWGDTNSFRFNILWYSDGNAYCQIEAGANSFPSAAIATGGWHHFALVLKGGTAAFYLDGLPKSLTAGGASPPSTYTVTGNFRIGREAANARFTAGRHDDVMLHDRALSASEAFTLYDLSRRGYPSC